MGIAQRGMATNGLIASLQIGRSAHTHCCPVIPI
jgi:hypothetical protein